MWVPRQAAGAAAATAAAAEAKGSGEMVHPEFKSRLHSTDNVY